MRSLTASFTLMSDLLDVAYSCQPLTRDVRVVITEVFPAHIVTDQAQPGDPGFTCARVILRHVHASLDQMLPVDLILLRCDRTLSLWRLAPRALVSLRGILIPSGLSIVSNQLIGASLLDPPWIVGSQRPGDDLDQWLAQGEHAAANPNGRQRAVVDLTQDGVIAHAEGVGHLLHGERKGGVVVSGHSWSIPVFQWA